MLRRILPVSLRPKAVLVISTFSKIVCGYGPVDIYWAERPTVLFINEFKSRDVRRSQDEMMVFIADFPKLAVQFNKFTNLMEPRD